MFLIYYWSDSIHFSPYPTGPPANIVLVKNVLSFTGILLAMMFVNDGQCNPVMKQKNKTAIDIGKAMVQKGFVFLV